MYPIFISEIWAPNNNQSDRELQHNQSANRHPSSASEIWKKQAFFRFWCYDKKQNNQ